MVQQENPAFEPNRRFGLDMFNVVIGIIAQCCLTILPMYLVLWMKAPFIDYRRHINHYHYYSEKNLVGQAGELNLAFL